MPRLVTPWRLAGGVLVVAVVAALIAVPRLAGSSGGCVDDLRTTDALGVEVTLDAMVTDPLHLSARVAEGLAPAVGTAVTVPGGLVPPPGTWADVLAVDPAEGGASVVTMAIRPLDQVGGFPGTPPIPTMTPGARGGVTAVIDPVDKAEYLTTVDRLPSDGTAPGAVRPGTVLVTRVVDGRVHYDQTPACAAPPVTASSAETAPPGTAPERTRTVRHETRPLHRLDVDEPLGPGGGVDLVPGPPGSLEEDLDLSWRGARPVTGEDRATGGPARVDPGGDDRRTTVGCAAPTPPERTHDCTAHYRIALPADAGVGARTTVDPITARDLRGDTALTTTSGPITMTGLAGTLRATSERGLVTGTRLSPETIYVVAGGPVDLRLDAPPRQLRVDGGAGAVTVELPRGATYDVETGVKPPGARPARVEVATDPASPHRIEARGDGDVTVRYAP